jgi:hypothetical protein
LKELGGRLWIKLIKNILNFKITLM